jgi:hypothetical protein
MRLPRYVYGSFTCRKATTWDRRLYFPSEGRHAEDFCRPKKIRRLSFLKEQPKTKQILREVTNTLGKGGGEEQCTYNNTEALSCNHCCCGVLHNLRVGICSLRYPACIAHAPYCHMWPAPFLQYSFHIFS